MFADIDWCNIYHVCVGNRDNIFLCPPGTIFNDTKQGCMDRFDGTNCNGTRSYYKPSITRHKRGVSPIEQRRFQSVVGSKQVVRKDNEQQIPYEEKKSYPSRQVLSSKSSHPYFSALNLLKYILFILAQSNSFEWQQRR
jgi:hypothetical protein